MKNFLKVALVALAVLFGTFQEARAATHTLTRNVGITIVSNTPWHITYKFNWSSLAAAGADTGTAILDLYDERSHLGDLYVSGLPKNSSALPILNMRMSCSFATNVDSARTEIAFSPDGGTTYFAQTVFMLNSTSLMTRAAPNLLLAITPQGGRKMRFLTNNRDATTAGLVDQYVTFFK